MRDSEWSNNKTGRFAATFGCLLTSDNAAVFPVDVISIIIIIIIINCNWVVTRWQWLFYMYTKYEIGY